MFGHLALSENGFLFDTRSGCTFSLNSTGAFILRSLVNGATESDLLENVTSQFDVDRTLAERDVMQFLFRLRELGLSAEEELC